LPEAWTPRDCLKHSETYGVPFLREQFIVIDDANVHPAYHDVDDGDFNDHCPKSQTNPYPVSRYDDLSQSRAEIDEEIMYYRGQFQKVKNMSLTHSTNFLASHRPVFGIACNGSDFVKMDWTLQQAILDTTMDLDWGERPPVTIPSLERISAIISGHMHWFEAVQFANRGLPDQLVVGNGGTKLIPNYMRMHEGGLLGLKVLGHQVNRSVVDSRFGFTLMTRGEGGYLVSARHLVLQPAGAYRSVWETHLPHGLRPHTLGERSILEWSGLEAMAVYKGALEGKGVLLSAAALGFFAFALAFTLRVRCARTSQPDEYFRLP